MSFKRILSYVLCLIFSLAGVSTLANDKKEKEEIITKTKVKKAGPIKKNSKMYPGSPDVVRTPTAPGPVPIPPPGANAPPPPDPDPKQTLKQTIKKQKKTSKGKKKGMNKGKKKGKKKEQ